MYCLNCGKPIPDGTKFCTGCGASQENKQSQQGQVRQRNRPMGKGMKILIGIASAAAITAAAVLLIPLMKGDAGKRIVTTPSSEPTATVISDYSGVYVFEVSDATVPFTISYWTYTLNRDGTYVEDLLWISGTQSTEGHNTGTWVIVDGQLITTPEGTYVVSTTFGINGDRLVMEFGDLLLTFKKQN
ncbi:MAG: zinc-ribbon domain-containing protein [Clostridia bacterium]